MYRSERILSAIGNIDERVLVDISQKQGYLKREARGGKKWRRLGRVLLIAAVLTALLGATAYAIGLSIHTQRQEQLRQDYHAEENHLSSYTEYAVPETAEPGVTLLSAYNDGLIETVFVNICPVPADEVRDPFMWDTGEDGRTHYLEYLTTVSGGERLSYAHFYVQDWDFAPEDYVTVTDVFGESREELKPEAKQARYFAQAYDAETQTLTLRCHFWLDELPAGAKQAQLRLFSWDVWGYPDEWNSISVDRETAVHRDFGTVTVEIVPPDTRVLLFPEAVEVRNDFDGCSGRLLGAELSSGQITWLMDVDEEVWPYLGTLSEFKGDDAAFRAAFERQLSWLNVQDALVEDACVVLADGERRAVGGVHATSGAEERPFRLYMRFGTRTIPVQDVVAIQVAGHSFAFPAAEQTPAGG